MAWRQNISILWGGAWQKKMRTTVLAKSHVDLSPRQAPIQFRHTQVVFPICSLSAVISVLPNTADSASAEQFSIRKHKRIAYNKLYSLNISVTCSMDCGEHWLLKSEQLVVDNIGYYSFFIVSDLWGQTGDQNFFSLSNCWKYILLSYYRCWASLHEICCTVSLHSSCSHSHSVIYFLSIFSSKSKLGSRKWR